MALQSLLNLPTIRYRVQDESRIGRKTETGRVMTAKGVKPIGPRRFNGLKLSFRFFNRPIVRNSTP